jgi:hypothetical protein
MSLVQLVIDDRMRGHSFDQIAQDRYLGSAGVAHAKLTEGIDCLADQNLRDVLRLELARLDEIHRHYWPDALAGSAKAARVITGIISTRYKLLLPLRDAQKEREQQQEHTPELSEMLEELRDFYSDREAYRAWRRTQVEPWVQLELLTA